MVDEAAVAGRASSPALAVWRMMRSSRRQRGVRRTGFEPWLPATLTVDSTES
jgi:hypothetical protein